MNYNQDFEAAKNWYKIAKEQNNQQAIDILEQLFPKLKDIYIVDTLISICNMALPDIFKKYGCDKDDVLEWLNSQYDKNMSLTDILNNDIPKREATGVEKKELKKLNIKPKFNEGDWVVDEEDNSVHQIKQSIENVTYGGFSYDLTDNGYFPYTKSNYHLWTINDAKDGDVVVVPSIEGSEHSEQIFIFKEIKNRDYVKNVVEYYCKVCDNEFYVNKRSFMGYADDYFVPATQEQQKLLFQKMKDAGYKWDDSKRKIEENSFKSDKVEKALHKAGYEWSEDTHELKKIEQKHTCSEKDDNFEVTDKNEEPSLFDNYNPYKAAVQHIIATCYEYEDVIDTDTYAAKFHDEIIAKCNNAIEYDNKYPKKKSLNVDDLNNIQSITKILNNAKKYYCNDDEIVRGIEWVNSLKNI